MKPETVAEERPRPKSLTDLFFSFTWLALQGFGGVLAIVQQELVERKRWLTREEFLEEWAVAQIMPGPNVVNLSLMIGSRYFGLPGAIAALGGMLAVPLVIALTLTFFYAQYGDHPGLAGALRGMSAVSAGLITATGLKLMSTLKTHPLRLAVSLVLAVVCFCAIALLRLPLMIVLPTLGLIACVLTYRKIKP